MATRVMPGERVSISGPAALALMRWMLADGGGSASLPGMQHEAVDLVSLARKWQPADLQQWLDWVEAHLEHPDRWLARPSEVEAGDVWWADTGQLSSGQQRLMVAAVIAHQAERLDCSDRTILDCLIQVARRVVQHECILQRIDESVHDRFIQMVYDFAYGLSHELNNPLASIATRAGVVASESDQVDVRLACQAIVEQAMRGREMLEDMMAVARPPRIEPAECDVSDIVREVIGRAEQWLRVNGLSVAVDVSGAEELLVRADPAALTEALWCLVRNALEAVDDQTGQIAVSAGQDAAWTTLMVIDNGPGIPPRLLDRVWNPYYSGREAGRGLGLGLCKVESIARLHGGRAELRNRPGGGCQATIYLPNDWRIE